MSYKNDVFSIIIKEISFETDIDSSHILYVHKDVDSVDATYITIRLLYGVGFYPIAIAKLLHRTARSVNSILLTFSARYQLYPIMRIQYERIKNRLLVNGIHVL